LWIGAGIVIGIGKGVFSSADFRVRHILAGIFLGVINYVAVYALLKILALEGWESSQLFPIYSVGVMAEAQCWRFCFSRRGYPGKKRSDSWWGLWLSASLTSDFCNPPTEGPQVDIRLFGYCRHGAMRAHYQRLAA
jgi:hypothetical protein